MEEKVRLTYLYDFYGDLLSQKQSEIFQSFVFNDLSLQEMADESGVSRQAVHDKVRRCVRALEGYEEKLHLYEKYRQIGEIADRLEQEIAGFKDMDEARWESILAMLGELKEVL